MVHKTDGESFSYIHNLGSINTCAAFTNTIIIANHHHYYGFITNTRSWEHTYKLNCKWRDFFLLLLQINRKLLLFGRDLLQLILFRELLRNLVWLGNDCRQKSWFTGHRQLNDVVLFTITFYIINGKWFTKYARSTYFTYIIDSSITFW